MSNVDKFKSMRNVADAYVQMRQKENAPADATVEPVEAEAHVEATHVADVADAKVEPTDVQEAANAYTHTQASKTRQAKANYKIAAASKAGAKYVKNGDDAGEEDDAPKKKKKVTINPELSEDGHDDVSSAIRKCKTMIEDAQEIMSALETMNPEDDLPSWWMNAIAVSANELNSMRDYIKNPKED